MVRTNSPLSLSAVTLKNKQPQEGKAFGFQRSGGRRANPCHGKIIGIQLIANHSQLRTNLTPENTDCFLTSINKLSTPQYREPPEYVV